MGFLESTKILLSNYTVASFHQLVFRRPVKPLKSISIDRKSGTEEFGYLVIPRLERVVSGYLEIQVENAEPVRCSKDQIFYDSDFNKIAAEKISAGAVLKGVKRSGKESADYLVKGVKYVSARQEVYTTSVPRYRSFALHCGLFAKA